jgi:RHS repeat-associated protein
VRIRLSIFHPLRFSVTTHTGVYTVTLSVGNGVLTDTLTRTNYGYTGEWWGSYNDLLFLRARWYVPETGTFLSRDSMPGEPPYLYAGGNPVNVTDPTGMWRWRVSSGSIYHDLIENHYEGTPGGLANPDKQLEYTIPSIRRRPDMFNSVIGDVYEIEPWFKAYEAAPQAYGYVTDLTQATQRENGLVGSYRGIPYDWNLTPFHLGTGVDWPGKLRTNLPGYQMVDLVADYTGEGTVLYWLEPKSGIPVYAVERVPNKRLLKERNWNPGSGTPAPAPAFVRVLRISCGIALIAIGTTIIVVTIVEDVTVLGTIDDIATIPGGYFLIDLGQRMAAFVQTPVLAPVP